MKREELERLQYQIIGQNIENEQLKGKGGIHMASKKGNSLLKEFGKLAKKSKSVSKVKVK